VFGEVPQISSWIGAGVIMVGVLMLIKTEAKSNRPLSD